MLLEKQSKAIIPGLFQADRGVLKDNFSHDKKARDWQLQSRQVLNHDIIHIVMKCKKNSQE